MLESRIFATSCIVKNSKLGAKSRLSSMFLYKSLRNGYHELKMYKFAGKIHASFETNLLYNFTFFLAEFPLCDKNAKSMSRNIYNYYPAVWHPRPQDLIFLAFDDRAQK